MDTQKFSVDHNTKALNAFRGIFRPTEGEDSHPHACLDGFVYMTYTAHDDEVGDEVERIEVIQCRRCSEGVA